MANTANVALRLPPPFKEAAKALVKAGFDEYDDVGNNVLSFHPRNTHDAIVKLMRVGVVRVLGALDGPVKEVNHSVETYREIMRYFLDHPNMKTVDGSKFRIGTKAWKFFDGPDSDSRSEYEKELARCKKEGESPDPDYIEELEANLVPYSILQEEAMHSLAKAKDRLDNLVNAGALLEMARDYNEQAA